ncbi:MAG: TetR/AcrR family transcriptional regulator C-terminal domain-containing protein [Gaiellaceae bacterium]
MTVEAKSERAPLTRRAVVEAALAIADAGGLEAISFRRLASELGVTPMALYRYVDGKEALLYGIAERVFEEFELPAETAGDWRDQLRVLGHSFRRLLVAHPAVAALFTLHPADVLSPNAARVIEVVLGVLRQAGFSPEEAALLESELERFVLALVMLETGGGPPASEEELQAHVRELRARLAMLPPDEFPHMLEAAPYFCKDSDPDWAFEFALDLMIGGLERLLEQRGPDGARR